MSKRRKRSQNQMQHAGKTPAKQLSRRQFSLGVTGIILTGAAGEAQQRSISLAPTASMALFRQPGMVPRTVDQPWDVFTEVAGCAWSPDGQTLALFQEQSVILYDASTGRQRLLYQQHTDDILTVKWSADSRYLASSGFDPTVHVWEASTGKTVTRYRGHNQIVREVAWTPQHTILASAGYDKTVQVWDALTGKMLVTCTGHRGEIIALAWSPDGRFLTSTDLNNTTRLWQIG